MSRLSGCRGSQIAVKRILHPHRLDPGRKGADYETAPAFPVLGSAVAAGLFLVRLTDRPVNSTVFRDWSEIASYRSSLRDDAIRRYLFSGKASNVLVRAAIGVYPWIVDILPELGQQDG